MRELGDSNSRQTAPARNCITLPLLRNRARFAVTAEFRRARRAQSVKRRARSRTARGYRKCVAFVDSHPTDRRPSAPTPLYNSQHSLTRSYPCSPAIETSDFHPPPHSNRFAGTDYVFYLFTVWLTDQCPVRRSRQQTHTLADTIAHWFTRKVRRISNCRPRLSSKTVTETETYGHFVSSICETTHRQLLKQDTKIMKRCLGTTKRSEQQPEYRCK